MFVLVRYVKIHAHERFRLTVRKFYFEKWNESKKLCCQKKGKSGIGFRSLARLTPNRFILIPSYVYSTSSTGPFIDHEHTRSRSSCDVIEYPASPWRVASFFRSIFTWVWFDFVFLFLVSFYYIIFSPYLSISLSLFLSLFLYYY